jgi:AhpD family alkylhydroperoxidase
MGSETKDRLSAAKGRIGMFAKAAPAAMDGFARLSKAAPSAGAFSSAQRELIATAIAVVKGCEDCILYHVDSARKHGAEESELVEALEIALEMGGGPALMYASKALEAYRDL